MRSDSGGCRCGAPPRPAAPRPLPAPGGPDLGARPLPSSLPPPRVTCRLPERGLRPFKARNRERGVRPECGLSDARVFQSGARGLRAVTAVFLWERGLRLAEVARAPPTRPSGWGRGGLRPRARGTRTQEEGSGRKLQVPRRPADLTGPAQAARGSSGAAPAGGRALPRSLSARRS